MNIILKTYHNYLKLFIFFVLIVLLFAPVILELIKIWSTNDDYSHGFFVMPIFIYMVWQKKDFLFTIQVETSWIGLIFLIIGNILYCISFIVKFHSLTYISIIIIILSCIYFLLGKKMVQNLLFPVLFLIFMFPIPSSIYIQITNPLKLFITDVSANFISLIGIPVYQEGNLLFFSKTKLEVAEACSGIRSLFSYIMLGCVFAVFCNKFINKIIIIFSAIPLAILMNIIRVSGTGFLSHFYGEKAAQGFYHEFTGFIFFAIGLIFLYVSAQ